MIGIKNPNSRFAAIEPGHYQLLPVAQLHVPMPPVVAPKEAALAAKPKSAKRSKKKLPKK